MNLLLPGRQLAGLFFSVWLLTALPAGAQSWLATMQQADSLQNLGDVPGCYVLYKRAVGQAAQEFGTQHANYARSLLSFGTTLSIKGSLPQAVDTLLMARQVLLALNRPRDSTLAETYESLALTYRRQNRLTDAIETYRQTLRAWETTAGRGSVHYATSLQGLAGVYQLQRRFDLCKPLLLEALANRKQANDQSSPEYASLVGNLGSVYNALEDYEQAEPLQRTSLALRQKAYGPDHPSTATAANNLGALYEKLGDYDQAILYNREALRIRTLRIPGSTDQAVSLQNLAVCLNRTGNPAQADSLYGLALSILEKKPGRQSMQYANALGNQAMARHQYRRSGVARPMLAEALQTIRQVSGTQNVLFTRMLNNAANVEHDLRNNRIADSLIGEALRILPQIAGKETVEYGSYTMNRAIYRFCLGDTTGALADLNEALDTYTQKILTNFLYLSPSQKEAFLARWVDTYPTYYSRTQELLRLPGMADKSYAITLFLKSLLLREHTRAMAVTGRSNPALRQQLDSLVALKAELNQQYSLPVNKRHAIDSLTTRAGQLEQKLARQSAPFRRVRQDMGATWQMVQAALRPDEAAIEFIHFPFHDGYELTDSVLYAALVLRPGWSHPRFVPLTHEKAIEALLRPASDVAIVSPERLRAQTQTLVNTNQLAQGEQLYTLIWQPLDSLLTGVRQVWFSPSGLLHKVSLAALPRAGHAGRVRYVVDQYALRQVSSTRSVGQPGATLRPRKALLYGGVSYGKPASTTAVWPDLPGTAREVTAIGAAWGASVTVVTGKAATKANLIRHLNTAPGVVHLASHAFFRATTNERTDFVRTTANDPVLLRSGVVLAGANTPGTTGSGILTGQELANLNLNGTDLVVLSACESGLGDVRGSEGVFGLQRAVKMAGAKSLLVSLWPVPDETTSRFMTLFYRNWRGQQPLASAFRQTQQTFRLQYPPAIWAAFVLIE